MLDDPFRSPPAIDHTGGSRGGRHATTVTSTSGLNRTFPHDGNRRLPCGVERDVHRRRSIGFLFAALVIVGCGPSASSPTAVNGTSPSTAAATIPSPTSVTGTTTTVPPSTTPGTQASTTAPTTTTTTAPVPSTLGVTGVVGRVTAGPTCPVERPDQPCPPNPVPGRVDAISAGGRTAGSATTDGDGRYTITLAPGAYTLRVVTGSNFPRCSDTPVTVTAGSTTTADIDCDTGIR
jgi:hypothetical protein